MEDVLIGLAALGTPIAGLTGVVWLLVREPKHVRDLRKLEVRKAQQDALLAEREQKRALAQREHDTYEQFLKDQEPPA